MTTDPHPRSRRPRPLDTRTRPCRPKLVPQSADRGDVDGPPGDRAALVLADRLALTVAEAGALLGISRALAYELVARGEIPSLRLGRRLVVPKVALLELLGLAPARER